MLKSSKHIKVDRTVSNVICTETALQSSSYGGRALAGRPVKSFRVRTRLGVSVW